MELTCSKCKCTLDSDNFDRQKSSKSGFRPYCKDCRRKYAREYAAGRKNDPDFVQRQLRAKKKYRASSKGKQREREYLSEYRSIEKNKQRDKEYGRDYYHKNKAKRLEAAVEWRNSNPEAIKVHARKASEKRKANPVYRLADKIRRSVKRACRQKGILKHGMTFELLEYTPQEIHGYLSQYLGKPCEVCKECEISLDSCHLDHITPVCTANSLQDVIKLSEMVNLRLICPDCNLKKGPKYEHPRSQSFPHSGNQVPS